MTKSEQIELNNLRSKNEKLSKKLDRIKDILQKFRKEKTENIQSS